MQTRQPSETGIYHVTKRGVGRQAVFENDSDYEALYNLLWREKQKCDVRIFAWCFMLNHVHLLLSADLTELSKFMQVVFSTYSLRFNKAHDRTGHVFQGRFASEPVESDEYLLAAVRYIHLNPEKAGIASHDSYRWSSYREYITQPSLIDEKVVTNLLPTKTEFASFHKTNCGFEVPDRQNGSRKDPIQAANRILTNTRLEDVKALPIKQRNECLLALRRGGLTIKQVAMVTGIGRNIIQRAGK